MNSSASRSTSQATPAANTRDFITGFVTPDGNVWGRPVGVTVAPDGSLLMSDDGTNTIWHIEYTGK